MIRRRLDQAVMVIAIASAVVQAQVPSPVRAPGTVTATDPLP